MQRVGDRGGKVRLGPIRRSETCPTSPDPTVQTGPPGVGTALSGGGTGDRKLAKPQTSPSAIVIEVFFNEPQREERMS